MSAYNKINGTYCSESYDLLTKVLRSDWGFTGFVMTDWMAGSDVVAQMKAGNDMIMPGNPDQTAAIAAAVKEGRLDEKILDTNVERILTILIESPRFKKYSYSNSPDLKKHADLARKAATEGMVLLKNKASALPLSAGIKSIAAFGNTSYDIITGGTGSGDVNEAYSVTLVEGLKNAGYSVDEKLREVYTAYIEKEKANRPERGFFEPELPISEMELGESQINRSAEKDDFAIVTIGRNAGEFSDRDSGEGDFNLSKAEKSVIEKVTHAFHARGKKCVVILKMKKPEKELKAFGKTRLLLPGESQTLSFTIDGRSLASYDSGASAWVAEAGTYAVKIGASSADIRQYGTFALERALVAKTESKALVPAVSTPTLHKKDG